MTIKSGTSKRRAQRRVSSLSVCMMMLGVLSMPSLVWAQSTGSPEITQKSSVTASPSHKDHSCGHVGGLPDVASVFDSQKGSVVAVQTELTPQPGRYGVRTSAARVPVGQGSGFVVDSTGYIVTNYHVIDGAQKIKVRFEQSDRVYEAKLVGQDRVTDIALLKVETGAPLEAVSLGSSKSTRVGEWVVAIGSPFGLEYSVTTGIVSAKGRKLGHGLYDDFLQTDASINPGNSGGPLFNLHGEVVGVNTAIVKDGQGIGFAVPVDMLRMILPQLKERGYVVRGYIGANLRDVDSSLIQQIDTVGDVKDGVLVAALEENGPAHRSGLRTGDVIVAVDGVPVTELHKVLVKIANTAPGDSIAVDALRGKRRVSLALKVVERPDTERPVRKVQAP